MTVASAHPGHSREDGFTLVELMVAMVVIGIVFAMFSVVLSATVRHSNEVRENTVLQGEARAAVDRLASDLRQAYTGDDTSPIQTMTATQLTFLSPDRGTPFHLRKIAYRLTGHDLERATALSTTTTGPPWTFPSLGSYAKQVGSITNTTLFTYFDAAGAATTTPADVASVKVTVTVATATAATRLYTYTTSIAPRATA
jgi:prepilin-type N-terminal cleavage/methylation domain-containing protein